MPVSIFQEKKGQGFLALFFTLFFLVVGSPTLAKENPDKETKKKESLKQSKYALGLGFGWLQDYAGSDQGRLRFLPFPIYRGDTFRMDRIDGMSGRVYSDRTWRLAWSFIFQFPTESKDIPIRRGMGDLDWMLSLGPMVERTLWTDYRNRFFFRFPVRLNTCTNFSTRTQFCGLVFNPGFRYAQHLKGAGELIYRFEAFAHTQEYNRYYYQVNPDETNFERPAFHSKAGFLGFVWGVIHTLPFTGWELVTAINYYDYGLSVNRESPLFRTPTNYSIFFAVSIDFN